MEADWSAIESERLHKNLMDDIEIATRKMDRDEVKRLVAEAPNGLIDDKQKENIIELANLRIDDYSKVAQKAQADISHNKWINAVREQAKLFNTLDEALDFIDSAKDLTLGEKASLRVAETADRNREKTAREEAYDLYVDGKHDEMVQGLDDPEYSIDAVIADPDIEATEKRSIVSDYRAFSTSSIPEVSDFDAVERVKVAQDAYAMGQSVTVDNKTFKADKQYALDALKNNFKDLDAADRKKYRNEIYEKQDSLHGKYRSDGRYFLKEAFLGGRTISVGGFAMRVPESPEEQRDYEQASNELEVLLEDYKTSGNWPSSLDFYKEVKTIEAKVKDPNYGVQLSPLQKTIGGVPVETRQGMSPEEVDKLLGRETKPVRKGPVPNPDFKMASPTKPEQVFDEDGKEVGLRRKDGSLFKVGSRMKRGGRALEYLGNHQWKEIK
jgi:hypothetical protein